MNIRWFLKKNVVALAVFLGRNSLQQATQIDDVSLSNTLDLCEPCKPLDLFFD